jgi:hypothetical protein
MLPQKIQLTRRRNCGCLTRIIHKIGNGNRGLRIFAYYRSFLSLWFCYKSRHSREGGNPGARNFLKNGFPIKDFGNDSREKDFLRYCYILTISKKPLKYLSSVQSKKL